MRTSRGWWWLSGIVAGALGLTASYLVAGLLHVRESPAVAVAESVIALTPGTIAEWAIQTFGTRDKSVLLLGMFTILAIVFAAIGRLARVRWWAAMAGFALLAVIGAVAVLSKPASSPVDQVPVLAGLVTWLVAVAVLAEWLRRWELVEGDAAVVRASVTGAPDEPEALPPVGPVGPVGPAVDAEADVDLTRTKRRFFLALGAMGGIAAFVGVVGRIAADGRRRVEESRRLLRLEGVTEPSLPPGVKVEVRGVTPWQTAAEDFYLIDTAIIKPTIEPADWRLRIHGMVDNEIELSYSDLVSREITENWITLNCVSNSVGGSLIGNAWWSGVRLAALLAEAGPQDGADAVLQTSDDGWSCGTPLSALRDDRNAMLAVAMNGAPLPIEHGFPVRTIVPGLYGFVSACKWVVDMEVTRFEDITAYWTDKGWSEMGPVKMSSRIDVPSNGGDVEAGEVVCGGMAWSQHTGISVVEVSLDGGAWVPADLARVPNDDTWVQWKAILTGVEEGDHDLRVRATDKTGLVQTGVVRDVLPDGATGWHEIGFSAKA